MEADVREFFLKWFVVGPLLFLFWLMAGVFLSPAWLIIVLFGVFIGAIDLKESPELFCDLIMIKWFWDQ